MESPIVHAQARRGNDFLKRLSAVHIAGLGIEAVENGARKRGEVEQETGISPRAMIGAAWATE